MNDLPSIPWMDVLSNFTWILGASIILAAIGYHEFLAHIYKNKRIDTFKRISFRKPLILGMILVSAGVGTSIHQPFFVAIAWILAILLMIWFFLLLKTQARLR